MLSAEFASRSAVLPITARGPCFKDDSEQVLEFVGYAEELKAILDEFEAFEPT